VISGRPDGDAAHICFLMDLLLSRKEFEAIKKSCMTVRNSVFLLLFFTSLAGVLCTTGNPPIQESPLPSTYVPPGKQIYKEHCAACHGSDGRGNGPAARSLRKPPSDLTTLAKRHGGAFPEDYVTNVLRFGLGLSTHGSSEMPVWGPIFQELEHYNEAAVRQRIKNLCEYFESIQRN
jgi:mono/diheme cytochrome c family protein